MAEATFQPFTIQQLRAVGDFARAYLWDVVFPDAPEPFKVWFPASDIEESSYSVESEQAEFFNMLFNFPKKLNLPKITLTFYDREDRICYKWIRSWIANVIFNLNVSGTTPSVSPLEEVVKEMYVLKLDHKKEIVDMVSYWVYPESIGDRGTSGNELSMFSVPFVVAGMSPV
jgi:hypothetical protein